MIRLAVSCLALLTPLTALAELPIIPRPLKVEEKKGAYVLKDGATVLIEGYSDKELILKLLNQASGLKLQLAKQGERGSIAIRAGKEATEAYKLEISANGILVTGHPFYGTMTLAQLLEGSKKSKGAAELAYASIEDNPRFRYRGYMLDESRHFSGETAVKRLLDGMARFKLNRLHWHLTDSAGWRIEIKKYPKLTEVGGRMNETAPTPDGPPQFYTQEQIKNIVAYAKARGISIIPEIDMPGHADAAVLAYPEHDGGGMIQNKNPNKWPHFTFNPAKKETLAFLDDILKEVATLFPDAGMIHFGGDEVHFGWHKWPQLPEVQELMKAENLKDNAEVEAWFNRRMAKSINDLGFKTAGWDEITARELPKDKTVVYWWRHDKPNVLKQSLAAGYPIVLCPRRPCYFDFIQDSSHKKGRTWGGFNPLSDVYNFPAGLKLSEQDEKQVLGIQACLWTETALTQARRDFMTWPRLVALGEAGWTSAERKDFTTFEERLKSNISWLKSHDIQTWDPYEKTPEVSDSGAKPDYPDKPE